MKKIFVLISLLLTVNTFASTKRVISTSPAITEVIYAIGAQEALVGVSTYCKYPADVKSKEVVGTPFDFDMEKAVRLKANLVLLGKVDNQQIKDNLSKLNISYSEIKQDSLDDILNSITKVADELNKGPRGKQIVGQIKSKFRLFRRQSLDLKKKVLVVIGHQETTNGMKDFFAMGDKTFYQDILQNLKLVNAFSSEGKPVLSNEDLMRMNPDIIIDILAPGKNEKSVKELWKKYYSHLNAVKSENVHVFSNDYALVPGPRVVNIMEDIFKAVNKK